MSSLGFYALGSAWLFALAAPLVLFYFLKLKRPRVQVPSLVLWRRVIEDRRVNSPFQRFKRNLLLLLQMALLMLLCLAALQPFWRAGQTQADRLPVLIDSFGQHGGPRRARAASRGWTSRRSRSAPSSRASSRASRCASSPSTAPPASAPTSPTTSACCADALDGHLRLRRAERPGGGAAHGAGHGERAAVRRGAALQRRQHTAARQLRPALQARLPPPEGRRAERRHHLAERHALRLRRLGRVRGGRGLGGRRRAADRSTSSTTASRSPRAA